jgi:erythromycin esterase-like protein
MFGSQKPPSDVVSSIRTAACPLPAARHYDRVISWLGDASIVLLGEATHGTHDFYAARAALTRRLIEEKDFAAVAIEGDWPDAYRVNRFVQEGAASEGPEEVLSGFARFPTWMWRNTAVVEFVAWLHEYNARGNMADHRAGFYGLDLYSLHASMRAVIHYLEKTDPAAARSARQAYACFDHFGEDPDTYAWASRQAGGTSCEEAVARQLMELRERRHKLMRREAAAMDEFFSAEQNARLAQNAEKYYRTMFLGRVESWNLRDRHMAETLDELRTHLQRHGRAPKIVVWAHNSHVGDARGTEASDQGELNLGQLARERYGEAAKLVGFTTYSGTVIAASEWGGVAEVKDVRPALPDSFEDVFHRTGVARFFLPLTGEGSAARALNKRRLERAIGVIYRPDTERVSHYFNANLAAQFDAVIHFDDTHAVEPLEAESQWDAAEAPETFPSGV